MFIYCGHYGHYHGSAQRACWTCTGGCAGNLIISTCLIYVIYIVEHITQRCNYYTANTC